MKAEARYDEVLGETRVDVASNCYTDTLPLLPAILFRQGEFDLKSQSLPLAVAILTAPYCGEVFEFAGMKIGADYADAIRLLLRPGANINTVDGHHRTISTGELDLVCDKARIDRSAPIVPRLADAVPVIRLDWSGDFVFPETRSSALHAFGQVHTNAEIFADETRVSIALGLLYGRDRIRNLYVQPRAPEGLDGFDRIGTALARVGVELCLLGS